MSVKKVCKLFLKALSRARLGKTEILIVRKLTEIFAYYVFKIVKNCCNCLDFVAVNFLKRSQVLRIRLDDLFAISYRLLRFFDNLL